MKIEVLKEELMDVLEAVGTTVAQKSTLPVLQAVLLEAEDGKLTIYGIDGTASARGTVYVEQEKAGVTCINYVLFKDVVKSLPNNNITIETDEHSCKFSCNNATFELVTYNPQDFPKPFGQTTQTSLQVNQQEFKATVSKVLPFVAPVEGTMPALTGVNFEIEDGRMTLVGCDGYRIAVTTIKGICEDEIKTSFVLPAKYVKEIARLCSADEDELQICIPSSGNTVSFELPNVVINIQRIAGNYPNWKKIIPAEFGATVRVNKDDLYGALERASLVFDDARERKTVLNIKNNQILITAQSDTSKVEESISAKADAEFRVGFNTRYLIDVLKQIESENIALKFVKADPISPVYVKDDNFAAFVLPIKLKEEQKTTAA
ncbi:DNA polymerase-3 subunit beta [Caldanaerobius fijiensis DSM 17918]|uniref:Beta sliding clamp n=1 Tax=Caldanaerobius fijiensis DSM 17918 TaxID=1121256 RepID=A0A1M5EC72_9THEO|nr:DNA polymerase III subunit beta [Caldanaerobius fijiensis]SHF76681.1 DNA polymerase-3 subunit beta [Caldanaerobius fijiensis DSM 17918]